MTSKQKAKGYTYEIKTEKLLNEIPGAIAKRNIMSGSLGQFNPELDGDIKLKLTKIKNLENVTYINQEGNYDYAPSATEFKDYKVEVKARAKDFPKWIEHSLTQGDLTVIWKLNGSGNKSEPFVFMRFEVFKELIE